MTKVPNLPYTQIIAALERDGWIVGSQRGSHIRLEKALPDEVLKLTVPAHSSSHFKASSFRFRAIFRIAVNLW